MKFALAVCFAALAFVAVSASDPSTTSTSKPAPVVTSSSEPVKPTISNPVVATDESPVPEQPTTTTSTSNNKKDESHVPILPQPPKATNALHRVPVYVDRNPVLETITNLAHEHQQQHKKLMNDSEVEAELEKEEVVKLPDIPWHEDGDNKPQEENKTNNSKMPELPIPSRCPQITGTGNGETSTLADLIHSSGPKAAQRGCRFYIMHELIDRNQRQEVWASMTIQQQINQTLDKCFNSCSHAYDNGTELNESCANGCRKTSLVTEAISQFAIPKLDELESEQHEQHEHDDSQQVPSPQQQPHRTFSIFIPIRPSNPVFDKDDESDTEMSRPFGSSFPIAIPDAVKQMLAMFQQASQSMMQSAHQSPQPSAGGRSNIQESELSVDSMGNSISISRSMSVMMTKDQDGHSKVVVVHTIPKVLVHRFGPPNGMGDGMANQALPPPMPSLEDLLPEPARGGHSSDGNANQLDGQDDDNDDLFGDNDQFRFKLYGHLSNRGHNGLEEDDSGSKTSASSQTHVYYYRTRLCYYLPRLLYLVALIMLMYVILWLLCAMPHMLGFGGSRRAGAGEAGGASPNGGLAVIANNSKCRKFLFSKSQKYFQLNNKQQRSNSTTSLPPPYPGNGEDCESCATEYDQAGPLPEKQPIPSDESVKTTSK